MIVKRIQYAAIDNVTRIPALRIYKRYTQKNAIVFLDHVIMRYLVGARPMKFYIKK
jgi:hypothetical protein